MTNKSSPNTIAKFYAEKFGFSVLPVHGVRNGKCTCGKPLCAHPGKHPATLGGVKDATSDLTTIDQIFKNHHNIGIRTGIESNLFVIDEDPAKGGSDSMVELKESFGPLPDTVIANTGGNGFHYYFLHEGNIKNLVNVWPGIDIRSTNGYVVAPPSTHASGRNYYFDGVFELGETPIARLPKPISDYLRNKSNNRISSSMELRMPITEGFRNSTIASLTGSFINKGLPQRTIITLLNTINRDCVTPPLTEDEVLRIIRSVHNTASKRRTSNV